MDSRSGLAARNQEQALVQRLLQVPVFARMSSRQLQVLLKLGRMVSLEPGESLWIEGDRPAGLYVLLKGRLAIVENGREAGHVEPLASLGEVQLLAGLPHGDEVVADDRCVLVELPGDILNQVFRRSSDLCQRVCRNVVALLSMRLQKANDQVSEVARRRAELDERIREAEIHVNDLNMIRGMRR